jgi:hypothetical protein
MTPCWMKAKSFDHQIEQKKRPALQCETGFADSILRSASNRRPSQPRIRMTFASRNLHRQAFDRNELGAQDVMPCRIQRRTKSLENFIASFRIGANRGEVALNRSSVSCCRRDSVPRNAMQSADSTTGEIFVSGLSRVMDDGRRSSDTLAQRPLKRYGASIEPGIDPFRPVMEDMEQFRAPKFAEDPVNSLHRIKCPSLAVTMKGNRAKQQHHPPRTHDVQARFRMLGAADRPPRPSAPPNARL